MPKKIIVGRILGAVPGGDAGQIAVEDVDSDGDVYTVRRGDNLRLVEPREDSRSGYAGLLYEFEVDA